MRYDKGQATEQFRGWSRSYDRSILQWLLFGPSQRALIQRMRERSVGDGSRILDVGCGTGRFAGRLREAFPSAHVVGVDLVPDMLLRGRDRWQALRGFASAVQGDSERLPFASGTFDVVTCSNSFHHYPDQQRAVAEMRRVLRPGGRLLLIDGYRDWIWGWFIYDVCVAGVEGAVHHASARRFREMFTRAGFTEVHQGAHTGAAPFLLTEGVAGPGPRAEADDPMQLVEAAGAEA